MRGSASLTLALYGFILRVAAQSGQSLLSTQEGDSECHNACTSLTSALGPIVYYDPKTPLSGFQNSYFNQRQGEVIPACIVTPNTAQEVGDIIKIIRQHNCVFAVKSGGHGMFPGASNAPGGITIDMKNFNDVLISDDLHTTRVGTGNRWEHVYKILDPMNRTVIGGRNTDVGVGGFLLGGGISFLSRKYGWGADNVKNYGVVLANGSLANIDQASAPDLYWALRGGGNNFGIVTHFDLETYSQETAWGGFINIILASPSWIQSRKAALSIQSAPLPRFTALRYTLSSTLITGLCKLGYCSTAEPVFRALKNYAFAEPGDTNAHFLLSIFRNPQTGAYLFNPSTIYSKPDSDPSIFREFTSMPIIYHSRKIRSLSSIGTETASLSTAGLRNAWSAISFKVDEQLFAKVMDIFIAEIESLPYVENIVPNMSFQLLSREEIVLSQKNGGNCLGLENGHWPLILLIVTFAWKNQEDDLVVEIAGKNIIDRIASTTKEMRLNHRFIYQNNANISQDVFAGYGEKNRKRLLGIQRKYDPEGVFSRLQPGYFKL